MIYAIVALAVTNVAALLAVVQVQRCRSDRRYHSVCRLDQVFGRKEVANDVARHVHKRRLADRDRHRVAVVAPRLA